MDIAIINHYRNLDRKLDLIIRERILCADLYNLLVEELNAYIECRECEPTLHLIGEIVEYLQDTLNNYSDYLRFCDFVDIELQLSFNRIKSLLKDISQIQQMMLNNSLKSTEDRLFEEILTDNVVKFFHNPRQLAVDFENIIFYTIDVSRNSFEPFYVEDYEREL